MANLHKTAMRNWPDPSSSSCEGAGLQDYWFLPGYQLDKTDEHFCQVDPCVEVKSIFLFLYRSNGISVAVVGPTVVDLINVPL